MKKIIFMRGVPGSGKTPWAMERFGEDPMAAILSAADYFLDETGKFKWVAHLTPQSHQWNQARFRNALAEGMETIVIDNTNIKAWDMKPYLNILKRYKEYQVFQKVIDCDLFDAAENSVHEVPLVSIARMDENFEEVLNMSHYGA
jgi:NEDD4-binding protein 2